MRHLIVLLVVLLAKEGELTPCNAPVEYTCKTPNPSPDMFVPGNKAEFKAYCSVTKNYLECLHSFDLACKGRSHFMGLYPPFSYHKIKNLLDNICDVESLHYKVLARNLPCIKQRVNAMEDLCYNSRKYVQRAYNEYLKEHPNRNIKDKSSRNMRSNCLSYVATAACLMRSIEQECGFSAYEVANEILLETQILAEKCEVDIFLELKEAVPKFDLSKPYKDDLKKYFVVEIL